MRGGDRLDVRARPLTRGRKRQQGAHLVEAEAEFPAAPDERQAPAVRFRIGAMPAFGATFNDADIDAIIKYIRSLKPEQG